MHSPQESAQPCDTSKAAASESLSLMHMHRPVDITPGRTPVCRAWPRGHVQAILKLADKLLVNDKAKLSGLPNYVLDAVRSVHGVKCGDDDR